MSYATTADMLKRFGDAEVLALTDRQGTGSMDPAVLQAALDDADGEINSYLSVRYTIPLSSVPAMVVMLAGDIARYRLQEDRTTDTVVERYKSAIAFLKDVAAGRANLGIDPTPATSEDLAQVSAPARVFTTDTLKGFAP